MKIQLESSPQSEDTIQDSEIVRSTILQMTELKSKDVSKNSEISESQVNQIEQKFSVLFISKSSSHWLIYGNSQNSIDSASREYLSPSPLLISSCFSTPSFSHPSFQVKFLPLLNLTILKKKKIK